MKRLIRTFAFVAVCTLGFAACQEEMLVESNTKGCVEILARTGEQLQTRTCVGNSAADGTVGILWSPRDRIGVYGTKGTKNAVFTSTSTGTVSEALFSGNLTAGETPAYAYYPYSEENNASDASSVRGTLKLEQAFDLTTGKLEADYKVGKPSFLPIEGNRYEFQFEHLFSLLQFDIDATGTALEDDRLERIILTLPTSRRLGGDFTFDIASKVVTWQGSTEGTNELTIKWSDVPALVNGAKYTGYITCAPDIHQGDEIKITILTSRFKAEFVRTALTDFQANTCYTFPLTLENYKNDMEVTSRPVIASFSFEANKNKGKILASKLVSENGTTRAITQIAETMTVSADSITSCIPYLYDFMLKPTFTVAEGLTVSVDGIAQTSGEDEQDFSRPVTYTVSNGTDSRDYVVSVTNSGLPIVVLTQSGGGNVDWEEAGIKVRAKSSEWVNTDKLSVYKNDGAMDVDNVACGIRLRGNSTQNFPKLPFAVKLDKKTSVLGLPKHKRWVLLANWMDRTMLRNAVAFEVAHKSAEAMPDGLGWNPHGYNVELVIDDRHVGNYYLCEQIKIDGGRVDIKDCYEDVVDDGNANPTVADCGYLLEFDDNMDENFKFRTDRGLPCMFKDDVPDNLYQVVKEKVETVEDYLEKGDYSSAYELLDINSVIDYFFVQELTFNDEYKHPKSVYMYIDGDSKLTAGPVWDFDWQTFVIPELVHEATSRYGGGYDCRDAGEWLYGASKLASRWSSLIGSDYKNDSPYMWYPLLFKDTGFRANVQERWRGIYPALLSVVSSIEELADKNRLSSDFNSAMWPITPLLKNTCGAAFNGDDEMPFDEAVETLKRAYTERLEWMNTQINSGNFVTDAE